MMTAQTNGTTSTEKFALKALRGDFSDVHRADDAATKAQRALAASRA